jgi:hypothetical protein
MSALQDWLAGMSSMEALAIVSALVPLVYGAWVLTLVLRGGDDSTGRFQIHKSLDRLQKIWPNRER